MRVGGGQVLNGALVLLIVGVAVTALFGEHGVTHLLRLRAERKALGDTAFGLFRTNERLRTEIAKLRDDELYLEGLARRSRGLVRPNETVYRFRPPTAP
jgi:cell division protein FtsB